MGYNTGAKFNREAEFTTKSIPELMELRDKLVKCTEEFKGAMLMELLDEVNLHIASRIGKSKKKD